MALILLFNKNNPHSVFYLGELEIFHGGTYRLVRGSVCKFSELNVRNFYNPAFWSPVNVNAFTTDNFIKQDISTDIKELYSKLPTI